MENGLELTILSPGSASNGGFEQILLEKTEDSTGWTVGKRPQGMPKVVPALAPDGGLVHCNTAARLRVISQPASGRSEPELESHHSWLSSMGGVQALEWAPLPAASSLLYAARTHLRRPRDTAEELRNEILVGAVRARSQPLIIILAQLTPESKNQEGPGNSCKGG